MQRFSIFIKDKKFYWTTNTIVYSIMFSCLGICLFKEKVLHIKRNLFDTFFMAIFGINMAVAFIVMFINLGKAKQLKGRLEGFLELKMDGIYIHEKKYPLEEIESIRISNDDYYGKRGSSRGNFGPALSNGTDNFIRLKLVTGETETYRFELYNADDFQKLKKELIHYHLNGKIDFSHLVYILGETDNNDKDELKHEIEEAASKTNN